MKIAAFGIVVKEYKFLLVHIRFPPQLWAPPGGFIDLGEYPEETVKRETWVETGIICEVFSKIHEFDFNDSHLLVYACQYVSGELQCSYESIEVSWFNVDDLPTSISPEIEVFHKAIESFKSEK